MLVSPGIPIRIGRNRSQPVFAGWYDDSWLILLNTKKGEELKVPHHASAAATRDGNLPLFPTALLVVA